MAITNPKAGDAGPTLMLVPVDRSPPPSEKPVAPLRAPDGIALVPGADVLLLAVELPVMPASQRRAAVGYAVEDQIAQPLDEVQVVLGPQLSQTLWLVAVIARSVLAAHVTDKADLALWPDVFLVPVPRSGWAVWAGEGRALVRLPDGTGFAASVQNLPGFWSAAGSPEIILYAGDLPAALAITARQELPLTPDPTLLGFDLRAGLSGPRGRLSLPTGARSVLIVAVVAVLAHLGLLIADVVALTRLANAKESELRILLNAPADSDLDAALTQALAQRQPADGGGGVLDLLTQVFGAIGTQTGRVSVQDLRYVATQNEAVLTLEAPDLATLQAVQTALSDTGLAVTAGAATTSDGAAEVQMTIRRGGS